MSSLKWTDRVERMGDGKLAKRADAKKVEGKGRPKLQKVDCIKRYLERVGEEWRTIIKYRRNWRLLIENVEREM